MELATKEDKGGRARFCYDVMLNTGFPVPHSCVNEDKMKREMDSIAKALILQLPTSDVNPGALDHFNLQSVAQVFKENTLFIWSLLRLAAKVQP